jgi:LacI family repressor for deo operon, udp, cdd, tsx, nupC, and nupG
LANSSKGIYAVAKLAGVSIATVSRVMAGSATVNEEMAARVRQAVAQLDYRPNATAAGLASGQHRTIGALVPDITNPYFATVMQAMSAGAASHDYRLVVGESRLSPSAELAIVEDLASQVDGLALIAPRMSPADLRKVATLDVPTVVLNRIDLGVDLPMVGADNFSAMLELCHYLVGLGHSRVVYLAGPEQSWQNRERWRGIAQAAKIFGLDATTVETDGTLESGHDAVAQAMTHQPTALICFNDLVAVGAIAALRDRQLSVPGDISVTGFDNAVLSRYVEPAITTVTSPMQQLGTVGWQLLNEALEGRRPEAPPPLLEATVVIRGSTGPAPRS